jgi:hypothetical protein
MSTNLLTFEDLTKIEPKLQALYDRAKNFPVYAGYCPIGNWYKFFKPKLIKLVGWTARKDDPVIRGHVAYDLCYRLIYAALPPCPKSCRRCG